MMSTGNKILILTNFTFLSKFRQEHNISIEIDYSGAGQFDYDSSFTLFLGFLHGIISQVMVGNL